VRVSLCICVFIFISSVWGVRVCDPPEAEKKHRNSQRLFIFRADRLTDKEGEHWTSGLEIDTGAIDGIT